DRNVTGVQTCALPIWCCGYGPATRTATPRPLLPRWPGSPRCTIPRPCSDRAVATVAPVANVRTVSRAPWWEYATPLWENPSEESRSMQAARYSDAACAAEVAATRYGAAAPPNAPAGTTVFLPVATPVASSTISSQHVGRNVRVIAHQRPAFGLPRLHAAGHVHRVPTVVVEPRSRLRRATAGAADHVQRAILRKFGEFVEPGRKFTERNVQRVRCVSGRPLVRLPHVEQGEVLRRQVRYGFHRHISERNSPRRQRRTPAGALRVRCAGPHSRPAGSDGPPGRPVAHRSHRPPRDRLRWVGLRCLPRRNRAA